MKRGVRGAAAFLAVAFTSAPALAQQGTPADCRALAIRSCSPDLCETKPLPGAEEADAGNWVATDRTDTLARVSLDRRGRHITINWDGRSWTGQVGRRWASGSVSGVAGTMREEFLPGLPGDATYQITWFRTGHGLLFSMIVDPAAEQEDYFVLNGACEPRS